jgi:hypothetical protein
VSGLFSHPLLENKPDTFFGHLFRNKPDVFLLSLEQKTDITLLGDIFMSQNKIIAIVLLVAGAIALYFGFNATSAPTEEISEALTGQYSDQTMLYLIGGAVSAVAGVVMLLRK